MDDVERLALLVFRLVRGVQPVEHARHDRRRRWPAGCAVWLSSTPSRNKQSDSPCTYSITRKSSSPQRDHVERRHHVGVANARREARLVEEHRHELGIAGRTAGADA